MKRICSLAALASLCFAPAASADRVGAESNVRTGNTNYFAGAYAAAEADYTRATTNDPTWAMPFNNRGLARFHQGRLAEAILDFDRARSLSNAYVSVYVNRGKCLAAQKDFAGAAAEFQAGLALAPTNAALRYNLAWTRDEQGLFGEAVSNYSATLLLQSNHWGALLGRGVSYARQGLASNAVADFYGVINGATNGDFLTTMAAYDLQLLRGPGLSFEDGAAATSYQEGIFDYASEQYEAALSQLASAGSNETRIADIPWISGWCYVRSRQTNAAPAALARAYALMERVSVQSLGTPSTIYLDGIRRGSTPATLPCFASRFDVTLRGFDGVHKVEWRGVTYADGTAGGADPMRLEPVTVTNLAPFGPVADTDRDWLADAWEVRWLGDLLQGPQSDETDHDGLLNLFEHWSSTDPTAADTDADGAPDHDEARVWGSDPARWNAFYYVNDASTSNDAWCTAPGNDTNSGVDPGQPKATIQAILAEYDLEPGDVVVIDTGTYELAGKILVGTKDGGSSNAPVFFQASPYGVTFDRNDPSTGSYGWDIQADYVRLTTATSGRYPSLPQRWMKITGAYCGVYIDGSYVQVSRLEASDNSYCGIYLCGPHTIAENCIARGNSDAANGTGIYVSNGQYPGSVVNCTVIGNGKYGVRCFYGGTLSNSIVAADGDGDYAVYRDSTGYVYDCDYSDHNLLFATNGARIGYSEGDRSTLAAWRAATGKDVRSIGRDPLLVDAAAGDCHLQSTAGSYHGGTWAPDAATGPGIDAGYGGAGAESEPNASSLHGAVDGLRNLGAYGGTEQGSRTPTNRLLRLYAPLGGENFLDPAAGPTCRWNWVGRGWQVADTVRLEYSTDSGGTWTAVAGAAAVPVTSGAFAWDASGVPSSPFCLVRIICNPDGAVADRSGAGFRVGTNLVYYVNDASTDNDAWCMAPGNDANSGFEPDRPKATVQSVLAEYDLEPGDSVLVDTGMYVLDGNVTVATADGGSSNAPVAFRASPYGVTFNRNNTASNSYAWEIEGSHVELATATDNPHPGLPLSWAKATGGNCGVRATGGSVRLRRVEASGNLHYGIHLGGPDAVAENCVARGNSDAVEGSGFRLSTGPYPARLVHCTAAGNGRYGVRLYFAAATVRNCILAAEGTGDYAIYRDDAGYGLGSDYNLLFAAGGALIGYSGGDRPSLANWQAATATDAFSLGGDPRFVNPAGGDYHLQSTAGSYHGGAWSDDSANSPGLDTGDPASTFSEEPAPNGGHVNLGAFGNTSQASTSADSDHDGLPDVYETYRLGTSPAAADTDGDGARDGDELIAGTVPTNRDSVFAAVDLEPDAGTGIAVRWLSAPNRTYFIERATNLILGGFTSWTNNIPATPPVNVHTDAAPSSSGVRFYRIGVQP